MFVTLRFGQVILLGAALSFIGLGAQPLTAELGAMAADGRNFLFFAPHVSVLPSLLIFIIVLAFNVLVTRSGTRSTRNSTNKLPEENQRMSKALKSLFIAGAAALTVGSMPAAAQQGNALTILRVIDADNTIRSAPPQRLPQKSSTCSPIPW